MIEIILSAMVVIGFVKVMWDIEATEKTVEVLTRKVLRLELDKLTDKMVKVDDTPVIKTIYGMADDDIIKVSNNLGIKPFPKKKVTKKAVKRVKKNEGNK